MGVCSNNGFVDKWWICWQNTPLYRQNSCYRTICHGSLLIDQYCVQFCDLLSRHITITNCQLVSTYNQKSFMPSTVFVFSQLLGLRGWFGTLGHVEAITKTDLLAHPSGTSCVYTIRHFLLSVIKAIDGSANLWVFWCSGAKTYRLLSIEK